MTDPVAEKSAFLCMYMSSHPDTLVAYAKWFGKVEEPISSAQMTSIDTKGMNLTCTLKSGQKKDVRVQIEPPLKGYDDVKPRLLEMKAFAQEGLGMIKSPVLKKFHVPLAALRDAVVIISLLCYISFFPRDSNNPIWQPAKWLYEITGEKPKYVLIVIVVLHFLEMFYTAYLSYAYQTGFLHGVTYSFLTVLIGFHMWRDLRRRAQAARIDSVMKVE